MRPIKILGIAPYEGIASLMQQAAESRSDLQIDIHVGNLTVGAEIAVAQTAHQAYDVILSRGGTAESIRQATDLKVVDIPLSVYDILRSIKLAENHNCKYAVIGFPAITRNATFLCEVLRCRPCRTAARLSSRAISRPCGCGIPPRRCTTTCLWPPAAMSCTNLSARC